MKAYISFMGRKAISWVVNTFYPGRVFWGRRAGDPLGYLAGARAETAIAAGLYLIHASVSRGDDATRVRYSSVPHEGGTADWTVTVERDAVIAKAKGE